MKQNTKLYCIGPAFPFFWGITQIFKGFSILIAIGLAVLLIIFLIIHLIKKQKLINSGSSELIILIVSLLAFFLIPLRAENNYLFLYVIFFLMLLLGQIWKKMIHLQTRRYVTLLLILFLITSVGATIYKITTITNSAFKATPETDTWGPEQLNCGGSSSWF